METWNYVTEVTSVNDFKRTAKEEFKVSQPREMGACEEVGTVEVDLSVIVTE